MSSLAGKMSLLVDEYNHSKTSPAYQKLSIKYKALKKSNQELIQLLTSLIGSLNDDTVRMALRRSQTLADRTHADQTFTDRTCTDQTYDYQDDILEEVQYDEDERPTRFLSECKKNGAFPTSVQEESNSLDIETNFVPSDLPRNDTDDVFEEKEEHDLESYHDEEEEEGEADCDEEEEGEDPDIKEQIVQEQVAESFAIQEEEIPTVVIEVEEEVVEYEEVEEVEETEEEVVEYEEEEVEEVEVTEEDEEEEVVEYEEVEEEVEYEEVEVTEEDEEEEAGVYEIEVKGTRYYTTNEKDGIVYALLEDDDVGDEVGKFVNGKLVLN